RPDADPPRNRPGRRTPPPRPRFPARRLANRSSPAHRRPRPANPARIAAGAESSWPPEAVADRRSSNHPATPPTPPSITAAPNRLATLSASFPCFLLLLGPGAGCPRFVPPLFLYLYYKQVHFNCQYFFLIFLK